MLKKLCRGVYTWKALETETKRHINGYVFTTRVGPVVVDPPRLNESVVKQFEALGTLKAIIVTGRPNERRAEQFQAWYGAKVFAPSKDQRRMRINADSWFHDGDVLPGGFKAVSLKNQRTPGESVLFHPKAKILVANQLHGFPGGTMSLPERGLYQQFGAAISAHLELLDLEFERLLPGSGEPVLTGGRVSLATYLAGLSGG